jgi:glycosyltransferase involved in cell wall biosynthesis
LKQRILIFYDHFYPSYKAGGPTQSLVNLIRELYKQYDFYVVCKPHEMGSTVLLNDVAPDDWNEWEGKAKVFYWQYNWSNKGKVQKLLEEVCPSVVYVNGLYSLYFNFLPLYYARQFKNKHQAVNIVLSARGMLHPGALSQKARKKKIYLELLKISGIPKMVKWHATDENEKSLIKVAMGSKADVSIAANFPNLQPLLEQPYKCPDRLLLGTIALISPMKNHLEVIKALFHVKATIEWHIFGPVKDNTYWSTCLSLIQRLPSNIKVYYHGELPPHLLSKAMRQFQVFIMPSKSENFGHAIVEALSPFGDIDLFKCGVAIQPDQLSQGLEKAIDKFAAMGEIDFSKAIEATQQYIAQKIEKASLQEAYHKLFDNSNENA